MIIDVIEASATKWDHEGLAAMLEESALYDPRCMEYAQPLKDDGEFDESRVRIIVHDKPVV